jgi:hypothetical protein
MSLPSHDGTKAGLWARRGETTLIGVKLQALRESRI